VRTELDAPLLAPGALADHPTPRALAAHVQECRPPPVAERKQQAAAPTAAATTSPAAAGWALLRELPPAPLPAAPGGATLPHLVALGDASSAAPGFLGAAAAALPQVFCLHSLHGRTAQFAHLATGLRGVASVLGLEHPLLRSGAAEDERPVSLAQLAARHAGSLVHASGLSRPHLVGESFGAVLAHATATTAEALGARPRLLAMVEPTPPRPYWKEFDAPASWSLAPPSFDAPFFLRLTGVELEAAAAARLGRLSAAQQLHGVVEVLVARGLAPDTAASARQVSRLASVTTLCQAALERQPRKLPPRPHEAGTLLLVANQRRQFFEQFVALVHVAEVAQLDAYGPRVREPLVLAASHFQAIHRILAQPESRLQATLAAAVLCTSPGMRRSSLTLTKAECAVGSRM